jgi:succinyl-CoA synthetase beta subunit
LAKFVSPTWPRAVDTPILSCGLTYADPPAYLIDLMSDEGLVPELGGLAHGPVAIERCAWWPEARADALANEGGRPELELPRITAPGEGWTEADVLEALASAGVRTAPHRLCATPEEAAAAADELGYPVVVKVSSAGIAHKSRIGAVVLGLEDRASVLGAVETVGTAAAVHSPDTTVNGVLVMKQVAEGLELLAGVTRDETWGPVLAISLGGAWAEVFAQPLLCSLPTTPARIETHLRSASFAPLLGGGNGLTSVEPAVLADQIWRISQLASSLDSVIDSLEVNPLMVEGGRTWALDGLIGMRDQTITTF